VSELAAHSALATAFSRAKPPRRPSSSVPRTRERQFRRLGPPRPCQQGCDDD